MSQKKELIEKELADRFHQLRQELLSMKEKATAYYFRLGEIMKEVRDNELWKLGYESFAAFYSDPELDFNKSRISRSIRFVEEFPEWQKFIDIPVGKLDVIVPHLTEGNRNELINQARTLSRGDLIHQLKIKRIAEVEPRLPPIPKIYPCLTCGKAKGISFDELCHCGWTPKQIEHVSMLIDGVNSGEYEV